MDLLTINYVTKQLYKKKKIDIPNEHTRGKEKLPEEGNPYFSGLNRWDFKI